MGIRICVDTNLFLNVKNKEKLHYKHSKKVLEAIDDGRAESIVPTVVIAELCAGYYEFNQLKEKDEFLTQLATNPNYEIIDLDLRITNEAGRIRAATGLHLPDAIIVASSLAASSSVIATHDIELTKARSLISVLSAEQVLRQLSSSPK
jgi:predicted nucleic acid-binding protein